MPIVVFFSLCNGLLSEVLGNNYVMTPVLGEHPRRERWMLRRETGECIDFARWPFSPSDEGQDGLTVQRYSSEVERRKSLPSITFAPLPCTQGRGVGGEG